MANKSVNGDVNVEFTESQSRQSLESGESVKTLFGKLRKWLTDLKAVAFSGSYNDLSNKPSIPSTPDDIGAAPAVKWTAVSKGQTWSRLFYSKEKSDYLGSSGILTIAATRANVVYSFTFLIISNFSLTANNSLKIIEIGSNHFSDVKIRGVTKRAAEFYFEVYDDSSGISSDTYQSWTCRYVPIYESIFEPYTSFTDGSTIPDNYYSTDIITTVKGSDAIAIRNITRSGNTFTATKQDGSMFTFSGVDFGTTAGTACEGNDSRVINALQKTGGTVTGAFSIKSSNIDRSVNPSATVNGNAPIYLYDKNNKIIGGVHISQNTAGIITLYFRSYSDDASTTQYGNYFGVSIDRNGNMTYSIASPANFRAAIGAAALADLSNYLPISGGTLTGDLTISQNNSSSVMAENTDAKTGIRMNAGNSRCEIQSYMEDENDVSHNWYMRLYDDSVSLVHKTGGAEDFDAIEYGSNGLTIGGIKSAANCKILVANKYQTSGGETVFEHDSFSIYEAAIKNCGAFMQYIESDLGGKRVYATIPLTLYRVSSGITCISGSAMISVSGTLQLIVVNWPQTTNDPLIEVKNISLS